MFKYQLKFKNATLFLQKLDFTKMHILYKNKLQYVFNSLNIALGITEHGASEIQKVSNLLI